ncbi:MAG: ribosome-associated translation inhibitor RaiA [Firmicutes bacterium]|nr:ribosome-associated translation inhibitor RaiA [Bacillota bacterium]
MEISVKGKNIEVTGALRSYAEKRVGKLEKFFEVGPVVAQVLLSTEGDRHVVEVTLQVNSLLLRGEQKTADMYASIDGVVEKIERQIDKYKTRINRKLRGEVKLAGAAAGVYPDEEEEGRTPGLGKVVRTKRFAIKPMSVEEAIMQMELLGHDFFVFSNDRSEEVNVVYKRRDGDYGLIEPY